MLEKSPFFFGISFSSVAVINNKLSKNERSLFNISNRQTTLIHGMKMISNKIQYIILVNVGTCTVIFNPSSEPLYNAFKFLSAEGCGHPLVWSLFNMVLSLGLLVILCHQKEIMEKKIYLLKQSLMTDFFKRIK